MTQNDILHQAEQAALRGEQQSRDQDAHAYRKALDEGDFEIMGIILQRAEVDPKLWQLIEEIHKVMLLADTIQITEEESHRLQHMILHIIRQFEDRKP